MTWVLFAATGALGALARWALDTWVSERLGSRLPWGILIVNVLGCLLLGASAALPADLARIAATGLLGSFTTFSTVFVGVVRMLGERRPLAAGGYIALSFALGVAALGLGILAVSELG